MGFGYQPSKRGSYNGNVSFYFTLNCDGSQKKDNREYVVEGKSGQWCGYVRGTGKTLQIAWDNYKKCVDEITAYEDWRGLRVIKQGSRTVAVSGRGF